MGSSTSSEADGYAHLAARVEEALPELVDRAIGADADLAAFADALRYPLEAGGKRLRRSLRAGTGYLSGNPPELHFGLGSARKIDACVVRWPSGRESRHSIDEIGAVVALDEPR